LKKNLTHNKNYICNIGFGGNSRVLPRIKFGAAGRENNPQSLTAAAPNIYEK